MNALWTIAGKDLKILFRDKAGLFWVFGFPLMIAVLFGTIFAGGEDGASKMKVSVQDLDNTDASRAFLKKLSESTAVEIKPKVVDAQGAVRKGDLVAAVTIPKGFGEVSMFSGQQPEIEVMIDPSRRAESGFLKGILAEASFAPMQQSFSNPEIAKVELTKSQRQVQADASMPEDQKKSLLQFLGAADEYFGKSQPATAGESAAFSGPKIKEVPVNRDQIGPRNSYDITFPQGIIWGLVGVATAFCISMVKERVGGTYMRLKVSPLSSSQLLLGKSLACFIASVAVMVVILLFGIAVFRIRVDSVPMLALSIFSSSVGIVGVMMLLSVIGKTEEAVSGAGRAALLIMSMLGGGMIPVMMMPSWMQSISNFSPIKWVGLSLEGAIWRGFTFAEMMLPCGILLAIGVGAFAVGSLVLAKTKD
ncbi:MAG: ABC transporter permease [Fimbriimonas sp.]